MTKCKIIYFKSLILGQNIKKYIENYEKNVGCPFNTYHSHICKVNIVSTFSSNHTFYNICIRVFILYIRHLKVKYNDKYII